MYKCSVIHGPGNFNSKFNTFVSSNIYLKEYKTSLRELELSQRFQVAWCLQLVDGELISEEVPLFPMKVGGG